MRRKISRKKAVDVREKSRRGLTLIEALLVISIIGILASVILTWINPARQMAQARNMSRWSDLHSILTGVQQFMIERSAGFLPIDSELRMIGTATSGCAVSCFQQEMTNAACVDLAASIVPQYIMSMPYDPKTGSSERTFYAVSLRNGRLDVRACSAEIDAVIHVVQ